MQIYVGNLPEKYDDKALRAMFESFGEVRSASVGEEKGYGFVEMPVKSEARKAIDELRGKELEKDKPLRVRALKPGDDFHSRAVALHGGSTSKGNAQFRDAGQRGGGSMMRRSGKRGG